MRIPEVVNDRDKSCYVILEKPLSALLLIKADLLERCSTRARHKAHRYGINHCNNMAKWPTNVSLCLPAY
jgi:hypothetical protein